jgi:HD superfamily phosphohydrolase
VLLIRSAIGDILRNALDPAELADLLAVLDLADRPENTPKDEFYAERLREYAYVADVVANTVCADVLDYIVRDLSACGMPVALGTRFLDYFEITPGNLPIPANRHRLALRLDKRGMPRPDVESEVLKLLSYRYELAERVFFHHAKNAASVMIGEAITLLGLHARDENFHWLTDDLLLAVLKTPGIAGALRLKLDTTSDRRAKAARLGELIARRKLYKLAYLGVSDDVSLKAKDIFRRWGEEPDARRDLQAQLAAKAGLESDRVLVHIPSPRMMTKLARVRVLLDEDTVTTFEDWEARHSGRVQTLNSAHARLWRVAVYMDPDDYEAEDGGRHRLVQSAARETFDLPSRYARIDIEVPYVAAVYDRIAPQNGWAVGQRTQHIERATQFAAKIDDPMDLEATIALLQRAVEGDTAAVDGEAAAADAQQTFTP